jgi:hypothetical protein
MTTEPNGVAGPETVPAAGAVATRSAFISYASPDKTKAFDIAGTLEARGLSCWIAPRDVRPGQEYGEEIINGIRDSRCLVLVFSAAANQSAMVRREVERAVSLNKPVFPVRIEEVLPARSLEFFVSATHWIDAWDGDVTAHITRLADEITDERRMSEVRGDLQRIRRRRQLPKQIGAAALVLAGVVTGVLLVDRESQQGGTATAESRWMEIAAAEAGIDLDGLGRDDFTVATKLGMASGLGTLVIGAPEALSGLIQRSALEYRVGNRPWKPVYYDSTGGLNIGYLDPKDMEARQPVQLRLNSATAQSAAVGRVYGPWEYDVDVQAQVNQVSGIANRPMLTKSIIGWQIDFSILEQLMKGARALRIGADPQRLTVRVEMIRPPSAAMSREEIRESAERGTAFADPATYAPFEKLDVVYTQVEFSDGTLGAVVANRAR